MPGDAGTADLPLTVAHQSTQTLAPRWLALARGLFALAGLVVVIVVVGGITRLTESGLSITEWHPLSGIVPPLGQAAWEAEFAHYRAIDQYAAVHSGMDVAAFKRIFFWEYSHRVLGRVMGLAVALVLAAAAWRGAIPRGYGWRLLAALVLVGVQGTLGWLMVASGLRPGMTEVAPPWLAAHLLTALFTMAWLVWTGLDLAALARHNMALTGAGSAPARITPAGITRLAGVSGAVLAVQLGYGALMAGLRAGHVTDQWPLMNGSVYPGPSEHGRSIVALLTADPATVHFIHRWWAWLAAIMLLAMAQRLRAAGNRREAGLILAALALQIVLGIVTVWSGVAIGIAALHQLVGALLVIAVTIGAHRLGAYRPGAGR